MGAQAVDDDTSTPETSTMLYKHRDAFLLRNDETRRRGLWLIGAAEGAVADGE
jgi:hypothetical protein